MLIHYIGAFHILFVKALRMISTAQEVKTRLQAWIQAQHKN